MYDIGIIGAGPAGYVAAEKASQNGLKVILFDKRSLGGVCLNEGCIPTKTLLYSAKIYDNAKQGAKYGITCNDISINFGKIMSRKKKVVRKLVAGINSKMKAYKVEYINSEAVITEKQKEHIIIESNGKTYACKNILISTGSEAFVPPIKGIDKTKIYTNREILQITKLPESITIIGGGVIGIEFASFFSSMDVKVTVIEMLNEILPGIDIEMTALLRDELTKKGVVFNLGARVTEINENEIVFEKNGETNYVSGEMTLMSVGRKANIEGFGIEKLGVEFTKNGIKIDNQCRTNIRNVYAAGDVTGFSLLAHTASREAEVVINNICGEVDLMRYNAIPGIIYTNPEIASVGLTEQSAKDENIDVIVRKLPMAYSGRFVAENEGKNGFAKVIANSQNNEILGVHFIGNPSSEIIYGAAIAIETKMQLNDMKKIVFPHPTVSEIFKETIFAFDD